MTYLVFVTAFDLDRHDILINELGKHILDKTAVQKVE